MSGHRRQVGLARALSKLGHCSRSRAFDLIREGQVRLNGRIRRDPETPVRLESDRIEVEGLTLAERPRTYLMLNKPKGLVTTSSDEKGRPTVYTCLGPEHARLSSVGRLDQASEGLLLFTDDTEWAARVTAPETHLDKLYHVQIDTVATPSLLRSIRAGVRVTERETLGAKRVRILRTGERNSWLEIVLDEGKNRHIRRMLAGLGIEVLRLVRVAVGPLQLGELAKGSVRELTRLEKENLDQAMRSARNRRSQPPCWRAPEPAGRPE